VPRNDSQSPAEAARTEAARQAVALAFAAVTVVALLPFQRRLIDMLMSGEREEVNPSGAREDRMRAAQQAAGRWDRATALLWQYGPWRAARWAHRRAEAARRAYEAERP